MAVGLALIFGILRLINFAHGDVMMVAAYLPCSRWLRGHAAAGALVVDARRHHPRRPGHGAGRLPAAARWPGGGAAADLLRGRADPPELGAARQRGWRASRSRSRSPRPSCCQRRRQPRAADWSPRSTWPASSSASVAAGAADRVRDAHPAGPVDAGGRRRTCRRAADGHPRQPGGHGRVRHRVRRWPPSPGFLYASQAGQINPYLGFTPVLKAFIAAVIGGFGSLVGRRAGRVRAGLPGGPAHRPLRHRRHHPRGLHPAGGARPPGSRSCPAHLASYRDAFVFVFLILMLLFRPNGLLRGRAREETP